MKKIILGAFVLGVLMCAPAFVFAQGNLGNISNLVTAIGNIIAKIIPIVFALILVYFFWGLVKFVMNAADEEARKGGKQMMIWGLVALFVASAVWGITRFIGDALNINPDANNSVNVPKINSNQINF